MKKLALLTTLVTSSLSFANSIDASSAYEYTEMRNIHHAGGGGGFGAGGYGGGGYGGSRGGISGRDISRDLDFKGGANRREREDNKQKDREDRSERQDRDRRDRDDRGGGGRNRKD